MKSIALVICFGLLLLSYVGFAQTDCTNALFEADKLYRKGQFNDCITTLESCKNSFHTKTQKFEAAHLMSLSYLALNQTENVKSNIHILLENNPEYQRFPNIDPLDFTRMLQEFEVRPRWFAGIKSGVVRNWSNLEQSYSVYRTESRYVPSTGYLIGLISDYRLTGHLGLQSDLVFMGLDIVHEVDNAGGWSQKYKESQKYAGLMLGLKYINQKQKFPGIQISGGFNMNYLYESSVFMESTRLETQARIQSTQDALSLRNQWQPGIYGGAGLEFWVLKGVLTIDGLYQHALTNTVNPNKRMTDTEFIYNNHYVNDDISLRNMQWLMGYKIPLSWRITEKKKP